MLAGAREVLQKPFKGDDLVAAVRRVHEFQVRKLAATEAAKAATAPPSKAVEDTAPRGKLITVLAGKGGVGKSVVATNLATLLAREHPGGVVMVDLSLQFGDVAALLDVKAERTIADLAAHDAVTDAEVVHQVLADGPEGMKVLAAPASPELADYVTTAHLRALLDELSRSHDIVVADATSQLSEISLESMDRSDRVLVVTDLSVTSVKNTKMLLSVVAHMRMDMARISLVVNHRDAPGITGLDRSRIEHFLGMRVLAEIPHDPIAMGASVDRGVPVVLSSPRSLSAIAFERLTEAMSIGSLAVAKR
jgi:pilus assembly protein CpaE